MIRVTYGILVQFEESAISDFVTYDVEAEDVSEIDIYDHAQVCADQLNYYCNLKKEKGTLLKFDCEGTDLTEEMNAILIKH